MYLDQWLEEVARPRLRPLTYSGYRVNVRHIKQTLGSHELSELTPLHVQELINTKLAEGLSGKTVAYVRQVLRTALRDAQRWELVPRNVVDMVPAPRVERPEIQPLEPEEVARLLKAAHGRRLEALYLVTLALGLRQGEVLGLQWSDLDSERGWLRVRRQLQRGPAGTRLVPPKSKQARRSLDLPPTVLQALRLHSLRQDAERDDAGECWQQTDLVFTTRTGGPLSARWLIRDFQRLLAAAGLRHLRFHDLRHSCATLLLVGGVSPRVVMEILGHSEIRLTMETYSHVIPPLRRDAAERMEAVLIDLAAER